MPKQCKHVQTMCDKHAKHVKNVKESVKKGAEICKRCKTVQESANTRQNTSALPNNKPSEKIKNKQERAPRGRERGAGAIQLTSFVGEGGVRGGGG